MKMKSLLAAMLVTYLCVGLRAGTPAQDKEFVDKYKAAFEKGDKAALESFLYTLKKTSEVQTGPDGSKAQLPLKLKKLKISFETKETSGNATNSATTFVAEKDGNYVIPVPAAVK